MTDNAPIPMRNTMLDKEPLTPGCCEWCGKETEPGDWACSNACEAQLHRLEATQGRLIIRFLKRWRMDRNNAARQTMLADTAPMVDKFLRSDRKRREAFQHARRTEAMAALREAADAQAAAAEARKGKGGPDGH